ncbi:MAG: hypothetical protein QOI21_4745 [Actinomycetota bacterium]|nr:hypothetical protein [Actinomycetota bacterium]
MGSGTFQAPPRPPRRPPARRPVPPKAEDHTEVFDAVVDDVAVSPALDDPPPLDAPPAGLAGWRKQRTKVAMDDTEIGVMPPVGDLPEIGVIEPTGRFAPAPPPYAPGRAAPPVASPDNGRLDLDDEYDYDDDAVDEYDDDLDDLDDDVIEDEDAEPDVHESPAKQWLMLGAQLALGVVGGAAVWLGFNWLWVEIPVAALTAALLMVAALVWIVRKIRRAEDLQTTVLAVLVGLVVTVSPAALLLVSR